MIARPMQMRHPSLFAVFAEPDECVVLGRKKVLSLLIEQQRRVAAIFGACVADAAGSLNDDQIDCAIRIIPQVALYAGHPDLLDKVEEGLRVLQDCDMPVAVGLAMTRVLEQYILNGNPEDVLAIVVSALSDRNRKNPQDLDIAVVGQSDKLFKLEAPHTLKLCQRFARSHAVDPAWFDYCDYVDGICSTMKAGGCNASRSGFIGACLAAKEGFNTIHDGWKSKTLRYEEVLDLALRLVAIKV